jgi:hypothetical protein
MISNFTRQIRQFKLWQFVDKSLAGQNTLLQSEILQFSKKHNLGSKKTVLTVLNEFIQNKMIIELALPPQGPGRPRKAYSLPQKSDEEPILINLSQLPIPLYNFIQVQSSTQKQGKSEVITQLLSWAFLQYQHGLAEMDRTPRKPFPPHLQSKEMTRDSLRSL